LFDSNFIKRLEYLSLLSKRVFKGQLLAQRRTKQTGGGIEFADHREYLPGDDLRYLDWNVYARHGDLLLKRFQEEEDLHVYVLLDCSHSMDEAGHVEQGAQTSLQRGNQRRAAQNKSPHALVTKFSFARQIAAALSYIALADLDRVSVLAYDNQIRGTMPLMRGKDNVLTVLRFLERLQTSGETTDLASVADDFARRAPRTGLVLVISDLFDHHGFRTGIDALRHRQFEPHVIQLHTPEEAAPNLLGDIQLEDVESGRSVKVTITERKLKEYQQMFADFTEQIDRYCKTYGLSYTRATNDVPFDEVLLRMMRTAGAIG
tara:strand:- start:191893 stop:192846 length:954 start_codon:yes stop_codon:yes gene_type:complete